MTKDDNRFRTMIESSQDWFWEFDENANFTYVSPRIKDLLGYDPEEVLGLNAFDLMNEEEAERVRKHFDPIAGKHLPFTRLENVNIHKDGHKVVFESSGTPIFDEDGNFSGYRGIDRDITERKAYEAALLAATQAAEDVKRDKARFLAQVSHEIRTPMTAIVGFGELLEDTDLTPEQRNFLASINGSSRALSSLIVDILDLSRIEAGELTIKSEDFNMREDITKVSEMLAPQVAEQGITFDTGIADEVPELLKGDSLRIRQVLLNLLGNAVKFTEKGSIHLDVAVVEESGDRVLLDISVKDTGTGIPAVLHKRIFEPFVQGSTQNHQGAGLGLAISRSLAELMGGRIQLESRLEKGSTFHLLIPLQRGADNRSGDTLHETAPAPWVGTCLNVLLVEDNPINSQFMMKALKNMGHEVQHAENGKIALDAAHANIFDLVLMDIEMPVMSGIDALHALRHIEATKEKHLKVIAMTAYALIGDKEKYLKMGFDGYLSKPFTIKGLMEEMGRVISV